MICRVRLRNPTEHCWKLFRLLHLSSFFPPEPRKRFLKDQGAKQGLSTVAGIQILIRIHTTLRNDPYSSAQG